MTIQDLATQPVDTALDDTARFDVCIVGVGRVGLPLGLSFTEAGLAATGLDLSPIIREQVNSGSMPFDEPGYDEIIGRREFLVHGETSIVSSADALVITVGTPLHQHIETDLSQVQRVLEQIRPYLREGQLICLRSTVAPGTTAFVRKWLDRHTPWTVGADLFLAFCPERLAEGRAYEEIHSLPQIVGSQDDESDRRATELFSRLAPEVLHTDYVTAELVKLFNNTLRYVHFAIANQFAMIADDFGANIHEARHLANYKYPRGFLAAPGFTAGTCLRKDFGMLNEWSAYPDMLLSAWKVNEYMPAFLVEHLLQRTRLHDANVAILGFSFKAEADDIRDSLAPKLWRRIHRELPMEIRVSDHHLPDPIPDPSAQTPRNFPIDEALRRADVVFVATNHDGYREALQELGRRRPGTWIADIWNVGGIDEMFYTAGRLVAAEVGA